MYISIKIAQSFMVNDGYSLLERPYSSIINGPMRERGRVAELKGSGVAVVQFQAGGACKRCGACLMKGGGVAEITAYNNVGAKKGDEVVVEVPEGQVVWASFLVFLLPAIALMAGYLLGSRAAQRLGTVDPQNLGIFFAVLFLGASLFGLNIYDRVFSRRKRPACEVVEIIR